MKKLIAIFYFISICTINFSCSSKAPTEQEIQKEIDDKAAETYIRKVEELKLTFESISDTNMSIQSRGENCLKLKNEYPDLLRDMFIQNAGSQEYIDIINTQIIPHIIAQEKAKVAMDKLIEAKEKLNKTK